MTRTNPSKRSRNREAMRRRKEMIQAYLINAHTLIHVQRGWPHDKIQPGSHWARRWNWHLEFVTFMKGKHGWRGLYR